MFTHDKAHRFQPSLDYHGNENMMLDQPFRQSGGEQDSPPGAVYAERLKFCSLQTVSLPPLPHDTHHRTAADDTCCMPAHTDMQEIDGYP